MPTTTMAPLTGSPMADAPAITTAFTVDGECYGWGDVVLAAMRWGEWADVEERAALGLACRRRADLEGARLEPAALAQAAADFRYRRGLVTAVEMRAWLARWLLDADEWLAWVEDAALRARWTAAAGAIAERHAASADAVASAAWPEAVCSGRLERLAERLAGDAAAAGAARRTPDLPSTVTADESLRAEMAHYALGPALAGAGPARLGHLAAVAARAAIFRADAVTPGALEAALRAHLLDWTRIDWATLRLPTEAAAREAACCVRADERPLAEAARAAGGTLAESRACLADAPAELRPHLLGAAAGQLLGPLPAADGFALVEVRARTLPDLADPETRRRAEAHVIDRAVRRETEQRVRWRLPR